MAERERVRPSAYEELDPEGPLKRISAAFRQVARQLKEETKPDQDDIRAIDVAKGLEEKAYGFYSATAKEVSDPTEKEIFERIAREENEHWRILDDARLYLTDPAQWHLKEERPLIDGG